MNTDDWQHLGWDALRAWAGAASLGQARHYLEQVSDLVATSDGQLLAWVAGRDRYGLRVRLVATDGRWQIESHCSCPVGQPCKHAVAAILVAQSRLRLGLSLAEATADDLRLGISVVLDQSEVPPVLQGSLDDGASAELLMTELAALSAPELLLLLGDLSERLPEVRRYLAERLGEKAMTG
jgi:uncharacterized Zn finger protein